ncbi:MAG: exonuclease subunit SbcC [Snowella sp.]|nr:exonuclease subunit SbcC [Snowella sp.]
MIPLQLTLKNFLSYRETTLDFRGIHTACICGANGAGKSSLLEAITWVIWGQSRAASEDDVLHTGADYVRVDFQFISNQQTYKVIRSRHRGKSSSLEFQIESNGSFRALTGKGLRATQEQVIDALKLDYDTFVNSAYLRQGRADEFMLRRPTERKQILADLLKLDQYEILAEQAKDIARNYKGQVDFLDLRLQSEKQQLSQQKELETNQVTLTQEIHSIQQLQDQDQWQLQQLKVTENQRRTWQQQLTWQQNQAQNLNLEIQRLGQEKRETEKQLTHLQQLLAQSTEIEQHYQAYLNLQKEEESLSHKFQIFQESQQQKQRLEQQLIQKQNELSLKIKQAQFQLDNLDQQEQELQSILNRSTEIQAGVEKLKKCRQQLADLDHLQSQVSPLQQRCYAIQVEIERAEAQLQAKLEQRQLLVADLSGKIQKVPDIRQEFQAINQQIKELDKKKIYQKRVEEKGQERRHFQERLQEHQRIYETQVEELNQKLQLLDIPDAICPLCEQELNEEHHHQVIRKTQAQQKEIQDQIWVLKEQMAVSARELQILRGEYADLASQLKIYDSLQQQYGQYESWLENTGEIHESLQALRLEIQQIEADLTHKTYAEDLYSELENLTQDLAKLKYDEQSHALARGEVERWRWAEIKQVKLDEATRRHSQIQAERPKLLKQVEQFQLESQQLRQSSDLQIQITEIDQQITALGYERSQHQGILQQLRENQIWQLRYQELKQAQEQLTPLQNRLQQLTDSMAERHAEQEKMQSELAHLRHQMEQFLDHQAEIETLEQQIQARRQTLDSLLARKGGLEQLARQLDMLKEQHKETTQQLQEAKKQYRIHKELSQAFGKNGIQTLMIENILPQLEAETNQILARLTSNQLHIQFVTQKASKGTSKRTTKFIDTLDILIADAQGTRPYETYSGGEAFRINFSIRLALAKLLAQRAGTALQLLIVDEGFGTQDAEGCERLVAAINAIASDFACILTVTHMPQFKESFQQRIEVQKSNQGSSLRILG